MVVYSFSVMNGKQQIFKPVYNRQKRFLQLPQYSGLTIVFHTGWIDMLDNTNATIQNVSEAEPTTTETTAKQATTVNGSDTDPVDIHEPGGSGYEERYKLVHITGCHFGQLRNFSDL